MAVYQNCQIVPVQAVASQQVSAGLGGQQVTLNIYTRGAYGYERVYMDVYANGALIVAGVLCYNGTEIVVNTWFGFIGDFAWWDTTQAGANPVYTGLGSRWVLAYYS